MVMIMMMVVMIIVIIFPIIIITVVVPFVLVIFVIVSLRDAFCKIASAWPVLPIGNRAGGSRQVSQLKKLSVKCDCSCDPSVPLWLDVALTAPSSPKQGLFAGSRSQSGVILALGALVQSLMP